MSAKWEKKDPSKWAYIWDFTVIKDIMNPVLYRSCTIREEAEWIVGITFDMSEIPAPLLQGLSKEGVADPPLQ